MREKRFNAREIDVDYDFIVEMFIVHHICKMRAIPKYYSLKQPFEQCN